MILKSDFYAVINKYGLIIDDCSDRFIVYINKVCRNKENNKLYKSASEIFEGRIINETLIEIVEATTLNLYSCEIDNYGGNLSDINLIDKFIEDEVKKYKLNDEKIKERYKKEVIRQKKEKIKVDFI